MIFKVIGTGIIGLVVSTFVKQYKPEIAISINIATGVIIFCLLLKSISELISEFLDLANNVNLPTNLMSIMLKVVGIGYIVEFASDVAEDSGNISIANKIVLGGKVIIACIALPLLIEMFKLLISML